MTRESIQVNVWPEQMKDGSGEAWFFAVWCDGSHDCNGDVPRDVINAVEWASMQWPNASVTEIEAT